MREAVQQVQVRRQRGVLTVILFGRTGRGVKYIVGQQPIKAASTSDKEYKSEVAEATTKLLERES